MKAKFNTLINGELPVLVDFFAEWCNPYKMQSTVLHEIAKDYEGRIKIIKIDVDKNTEVAGQYGVQSIPTMYLFKKGEVLWRKVGLSNKKELLDLLNQFAPEPEIKDR